MTDWSSLEAEARKRTREVGPRCAVEVFLSHLDPENVKTVSGVLCDPNLTNVGIHRAMRAKTRGDVPSLWSIGNHRNKKCRCSR